MSGALTFVAIGDSFTEGVGDPDPVTGAERGWADRVAVTLARQRPPVRYANLAVRGQVLDQILATQLPRALAMRPGLVSLCAAGNDLLRPGADLPALAARLDETVGILRATGADVVLFTGFDTRAVPVVRLASRRIAAINDDLRATARRHGALLVDLWAMPTLADPRTRADDRLHLNPDGHARVADRVCEVLGLEAEGDWRRPWPALPAPAPWWGRRAEDARWAREHLLPWVGRRVRGHSTGAGRPPKHPEPVPVG